MFHIKSKFIQFILIGFCLLSTQCSNDFDLTSQWKEISIIYGFIDPNSSKNYIRIEKAFIDENTSAQTIAGVTDSLYPLDPLQVTITELKSGIVHTLQKVNGDTLGMPKDNGVFGTTPNVLYELNATLDKKSLIKLIVKNTRTGRIDSATCALVSGFLPLNPGNSTPSPGLTFTYSPIESDEYSFSCYSGSNAKVFDLRGKIIIQNEDLTGAITGIDTLDWLIDENVVYNSSNAADAIKFIVKKDDFYRLIQNKLDPIPNIVRRFVGIDFTYYIGGMEYYNYKTTNNAQSGLTSDQALPKYTNIKGDGSLGLFTCVMKVQVNGVIIDAGSIDKLACSSFTEDLGFVSSNGNPC